MFSSKSRSERRRSKVTVSEEDVERRKELRRALHQRLRDELLADRAASQGGYDDDAEIMVTPHMTKSKSGGATKMSPKELTNLMRRFESLQSDAGLREDFYQPRPSAVESGLSGKAADILGHHTNASLVTSVWEDDMPCEDASSFQAADEIKQIMMSPRKGSVEIVDIPAQPDNASLSLNPCLLRSDTVVRTTRTNTRVPQRGSSASDVEALDEPASPELQALRMPSITESVQRDWRLSLTSSRHGSFSPTRACTLNLRPIVAFMPNGGEPTGTDGARHKTLGLLDSTGRWEGSHLSESKEEPASKVHPHRCDPASEERDFGGVDGPYSDNRPREDACSMKEIECVAATNTAPKVAEEVKQTSPRRPLMNGISLPQLPTMDRHSRRTSSGARSAAYSLQNRRGRHSSSSGYTLPPQKHSDLQGSGSSTYTFQEDDSSSSTRLSTAQFRTLSDKLGEIRVPGSGIPTFLGWNSSTNLNSQGFTKEHAESERSRRRTIDTTSFQSSTDSFRARELTAAAARIVPKPRTLTKPKISRFKEELEEEDMRAKSLGRKSTLGKGFSKRGNFRSYDGSEEWYSTGARRGYGFAFVPEDGECAASMWERALQDHADEVATTPARRRPRSIFGGYKMPRKSTGPRTKSRAMSRAVVSPRPPQDLPPSMPQSLGSDKHMVTDIPVIVTPITRRAMGHISPTNSMSSWMKYPSHTRPQRSDRSANEGDHVVSQDFAAALADESPKSRRSFLGKRKKSRSMTFSRKIFQSWSKLHKSQSASNVKSHFRNTIRSSIAGPILQGQCSESDAFSLRSPATPHSIGRNAAKILFPMSDKLDSKPGSKVEDDRDVYTTERSAKSWSNLYADCIMEPEEETTMEARSVRDVQMMNYLTSDPLTSKATLNELKEPSETSSIGLRESTVDFQRSLRAQEGEARLRALGAAKRILGE